MSRAKAQRSKERKSSQSENEISGIIMGYICSLRARLEAPIVAALREENVFGLGLSGSVKNQIRHIKIGGLS